MKKSHVALAALLTIAANSNSHASLFNVLKDSFSKFHGEGLPKKVGQSSVANEYRADFMDRMGIFSVIDELGLEQFTNNDIGLALIKKGNDDEAAFNTVLAQKNYRKLIDWKNGPQFLDALEEYTEQYGCIPKITSVSHGWRSSERPGEGNGLSGNKGTNGIYATKKSVPSSFGRFGARSIEEHLAEKIEEGKIQFCGACVAQFYACNVGAKFASTFSKVSGCQTVVATGQNSPWFQSSATSEERQKVYKGAHYWKSAAGVWAESSSEAKKKGYEALGSWYRSTPVKDSRGRVREIVSENLGGQYISL